MTRVMCRLMLLLLSLIVKFAQLDLIPDSRLNAVSDTLYAEKHVEEEEDCLVLLQTSAGLQASPKKKRQDTFLDGALQPPPKVDKQATGFVDVASLTALRVGSSVSLGSQEGATASTAAGMTVSRRVALTEEGYQTVVSEKNDEEMKAFTRRVLAANGLGVNNSEEGTFSGLVPYYSGVTASQSLQRLQEELQSVPWVVRIPAFIAESLMNGASGAAAPLTEAGYQLVAAMQSDSQMITFMRRLLEKDHVRLRDGAAATASLEELAPRYSGTSSEQTLAQLRRELLFLVPLSEAVQADAAHPSWEQI